MTIIDDDTPEPIPAQVGWIDANPPVELRDGRYYATLTARWTECSSGHPKFVVPDVAVGRSLCPQCGNKPAVHLTRAVFSSVTEQVVADEVDRVSQLRPRNYFTTEGRHDIDLDAQGVGAAGSDGGKGNGKA